MVIIAKLIFFFATMNAGKTTFLLQKIFELNNHNMPIAIFTSEIDDRYSVGLIKSRIGISRKALTYNNTFSFETYTQNHPKIKFILIDEGQFLTPEQVEELTEIAHTKNIYIMVFGLRSDFKGNTFPGSNKLLAIADELIEIQSFCHCGQKATMNIRKKLNNKELNDQQTVIGGSEMYSSVCFKHFLENKKNLKNQNNKQLVKIQCQNSKNKTLK